MYRQLSPKLDYFEQFTSRCFLELFRNDHLLDFTLVTFDDQQIKAHNVILSSVSSFLKSLINNSPGNTKFCVNYIAYKGVHMIKKLIYQGKFIAAEDKLVCLLAAGNYLKVEGLLEGVRPINITIISAERCKKEKAVK